MVQGSRAKKGTMTWQEEYKRKVMGPQEAVPVRPVEYAHGMIISWSREEAQ
jgi:hypothetical protein